MIYSYCKPQRQDINDKQNNNNNNNQLSLSLGLHFFISRIGTMITLISSYHLYYDYDHNLCFVISITLYILCICLVLLSGFICFRIESNKNNIYNRSHTNASITSQDVWNTHKNDERDRIENDINAK